MLYSNDEIKKITKEITRESFASIQNAELFTSICSLYEKHGSVDISMLSMANGMKDVVYIASLTDTVSTGSNWSFYANIMLKEQKLRNFKKVLALTSDLTSENVDYKIQELLEMTSNIKESGVCKQEKDRLTIENLESELKVRKISVKHNVITNNIEISGYSETESDEHILANLPAILYSDLGDAYKAISMENITNFLNVIATRNKYNPVLEYLNDKEWDNTDRFEEIFSALNLEETDWLSRILIKKWFYQGISLLNNSVSAPFGADGVLTLMGGQGIGKTSFFRNVAMKPCWFRAGQSINSYDKDTKRRVVTTWIAELGEVETTLKSDMESLKAFITDEYDEYRLPYGRVDQRNARHTNLCATCNSQRFLIDTSGNRRFWTIPLVSINIEALNKIDFVQVWLQSKDFVKKNGLQCFRLEGKEREALNERNSLHEKLMKSESEVIDIITKSVIEASKFEIVEMTVSEFKNRYDVLKGYSVEQIGKALSKHGFDSKRKKINGVVLSVRELPRLKDFQPF
jgi:predicted P-loop ATPase